MRNLVTALALSSLLMTGPALAGPGHEHDENGGHSHSHGPVSSDDAAASASKKVKQLAAAGKIDPSWAETMPASVEQKTYDKGPEWVITFKNDKVADASKQTLYVFYSLDGHYIAANYTGN